MKIDHSGAAGEVQRRAEEALARADLQGAIVHLLLAHSFEDGPGGQVKRTANGELGLVCRIGREVVR